METLRNIATAYYNLLKDKKYESTDERIKICQNCEFSKYFVSVLYCQICNCPIAAKSRLEKNTCPKNKWSK